MVTLDAIRSFLFGLVTALDHPNLLLRQPIQLIYQPVGVRPIQPKLVRSRLIEGLPDECLRGAELMYIRDRQFYVPGAPVADGGNVASKVRRIHQAVKLQFQPDAQASLVKVNGTEGPLALMVSNVFGKEFLRHCTR